MATTSEPLPPLSLVLTSTPEASSHLTNALSLLFEPSPPLIFDLVPQLASKFLNSSQLTTYAQLIDEALSVIRSWPDELKARFVGAHPRIGEVKGLSAMSAKEQGQTSVQAAPTVTLTSPEVLARLAHLNALYEHRYPGLRYITFVNGRSRAAIADEMEDKLGLPRSLDPSQPHIENVGVVEVGGEEWKKELYRAVEDVGLIAKSRLRAMGVE